MTRKELKIIRKRNKLTQTQMAKKLGTYQTRLSGWELGDREIPLYIIKLIEQLLFNKVLN